MRRWLCNPRRILRYTDCSWILSLRPRQVRLMNAFSVVCPTSERQSSTQLGGESLEALLFLMFAAL